MKFFEYLLVPSKNLSQPSLGGDVAVLEILVDHAPDQLLAFCVLHYSRNAS
jgi:hypothetical protein